MKPDWDLTGAAEDARAVLRRRLPRRQRRQVPEWKPGNEFKAKRDAVAEKVIKVRARTARADVKSASRGAGPSTIQEETINAISRIADCADARRNDRTWARASCSTADAVDDVVKNSSGV